MMTRQRLPSLPLVRTMLRPHKGGPAVPTARKGEVRTKLDSLVAGATPSLFAILELLDPSSRLMNAAMETNAIGNTI
jgi:hypothetical protein